MSIKIYYKFHNDVNDLSGNGNHGTGYNLTYGQQYGRIDGGISLNGSTSYITIPVAAVSSGDYTIHLSVRHDTSYVYPAETLFGSSSNGALWGIVHTQDAVKTYNIIGGSATISEYPSLGNSSVLANKFRNIAFTYFYANSTANFQVFFETKPGSLVTNGSQRTTPTAFYLSNGDPWWKKFRGEFDEFIFDNRAWSNAEIKNKYASDIGFF